MNEEYIYDFMGNLVPNPDYIPPSGTWGSVVNNPPPATTTNPPVTSNPPPATTSNPPPATTPDTTPDVPAVTNPNTNTMPLNGVDELIIDPITGLPIGQTPGADSTGSGGVPPVDPNVPPVTNPPPVTPVTDNSNPGNTDVGTGGTGGTTGNPTAANSNPFINTASTSNGTGWGDLAGGLNVPQASVSGVGGNYNQVQNANQGGVFSTAGSSTGEQNMTSGQSGTQATTGQQSSTVDTSQTTQADDTLGFGALLKDAATGAQGTDAARTGFLTDTMNTGGSQLGSQVDQAVRNSLSGPGMTGAGESARARAAGYAGAEIGRNNLNQRLAASEQLAGPTALTSLSSAANPFVGSTTSGTQQSLTDSLQNVASNSTGWQNLLSQASEAQSGNTAAQSSQAGAGTIPEGQPVKTGGCVLCTAAIELGLSNHRRVLRRVIKHKLHHDWKNFRLAARGYFAVFTPFARYLLSHPSLAKLLWPLAKGVVYEELRVSGRKQLPLRVGAWITHWVGHGACSIVGALPVRGHVTDPVILAIARRENIIFNVRS